MSAPVSSEPGERGGYCFDRQQQVSGERVYAPLDERGRVHVALRFLNDISCVVKQVMPELVREREPGATQRVVGVDHQQRRRSVVRA